VLLLYPSHQSISSNPFPKLIDRYSRNRRSGRHEFGFTYSPDVAHPGLKKRRVDHGATRHVARRIHGNPRLLPGIYPSETPCCSREYAVSRRVPHFRSVVEQIHHEGPLTTTSRLHLRIDAPTDFDRGANDLRHVLR
jgi:hypothetical protein